MVTGAVPFEEEMVDTVEMVGRLTRDPTLDRTSGGKPAVRLRVAVPRRDREHPDYITVVADDGLAETAATWCPVGRSALPGGSARRSGVATLTSGASVPRWRRPSNPRLATG